MINNKKGITLIVLVITIIVGIILASAGIVSVSSAITEATKASFAEELKLIEDEISVYLLQNDEYPGVEDASTNNLKTYSPKDISENVIKKEKNFNELAEEMKKNKENGNEDITNTTETKAFYIVDIDKLNLDKKTRGTKYNIENNEDVYVVSAKTNKVYYLKGVKTGGNTYFSLTDKIVKYVGNVEGTLEGEVTVETIGSLTVKRLKKTWSNTMGITLNVSGATEGEISATLKYGDTSATSNFNLKETYSINNLNDLEGNTFSADEKQNFYNSSDKKIVFTRGDDSLEVDLSNYDTQAPSYGNINEDWSVNENNNDENIVEFKVTDKVSGVKEIRYSYLTKYDKSGNPLNYYKDTDNLDASFIKARGKKAEISEGGNVVLKVPKEVEAIQIVIIDKAGNYPVDAETGYPITYVIKQDYIGCELKTINSVGLTFNTIFNTLNTDNLVTGYKVQVSTDGKTYTNPITKEFTDKTKEIQVDLVEDYKENITISDKVYVRVIGNFVDKNDSTKVVEKERRFEFSSKKEENDEVVTADVTIGETLTLNVTNPQEGAEYQWRDFEGNLNREGNSITLNEAEVVAYEGKKIYYLEIVNGNVNQGSPIEYTINYTITNEEQLTGIGKILSGLATTELDTDEKIKTLEGKTVKIGNDIYIREWAFLDDNNIMLRTTFNGTIDGNNHTLEFGNSLGVDGIGLVQTLNGTIKNLNLTGVASNDLDGSFAGLNKGTIENCTTTVGDTFSNNSSGGICYSNEGIIKNCTVDFTTAVSGNERAFDSFLVNFSNSRVKGGICAINNGTIEKCKNITTEKYPKKQSSIVCSGAIYGGICGINYGDILWCYNNAGIGLTSGSDSYSKVGGICGVMVEGNIKYCYNTGNFYDATDISWSSTSNTLGGIVGATISESNAEISYCYNQGGTEYICSYYAAGICGTNYGATLKINACYNLEDFRTNHGGYDKLGSGIIEYSQSNTVVSNSYTTSSYYITQASGNVEVSNSYVVYSSDSVQEVCDKLNSADLTNPLYKVLDGHKYPALYWEE